MDIAAFLKDTREAANLSLPEMAELAGMTHATLSAYERGTRAPRLDQLDRLLQGLGLQLRLEAEPLWADVDAAIDSAAAVPVTQRLAQLRVEPLALLGELHDVPCVVEGMCAAALLGAPVPVAVIDLVLPIDDEVLERFSQWAARNARRWSNQWRRFGFTVADPRQGRDPLRYETSYGELRLRLADPLPDSLLVQIGEQSVRVIDLRHVAATDPVAGRVLQRMQQRLSTGD